MRAALPLPFLLPAAPALADPVGSFTGDCYMKLDCDATEWSVEANLDKGVLSTVVEDYEIFDVTEHTTLQIAAGGMSAITFYGECQ